MSEFDQAQSPRLGQRTPYEGTTVRQFTGEELPEVSVDGQIIFRKDTNILQVYSEEDAAWQDVAGGEAEQLTYVGDTAPPTPPAKENDLWYDTAHGHKLWYHDGLDWTEALLGTEAFEPEVQEALTTAVDAHVIANQATVDISTVKLYQSRTHMIY